MGGVSDNIRPSFKEITGFSPYPYQKLVLETLKQGRSVMLKVPTGTGKSEAVLVPWLIFRNDKLPYRMVYSLPMRSLVNSLAERFEDYAQRSGATIKAQHGQKPESVLFNADGIVATLDQVITSYTCCPLNLGIRHGIIPAGAVVSSFLIRYRVRNQCIYGHNYGRPLSPIHGWSNDLR